MKVLPMNTYQPRSQTNFKAVNQKYYNKAVTMKILPMNTYQPRSQTNFKVVNQKYYNKAVEEVNGMGYLGELLEQIRFDVAFGDMHPQDGIDIVNAIIKLRGRSNAFFEHILESLYSRLRRMG